MNEMLMFFFFIIKNFDIVYGLNGFCNSCWMKCICVFLYSGYFDGFWFFVFESDSVKMFIVYLADFFKLKKEDEC